MRTRWASTRGIKIGLESRSLLRLQQATRQQAGGLQIRGVESRSLLRERASKLHASKLADSISTPASCGLQAIIAPMLKDLRLRLLDLYNRLDYPLRQAFRWQRGASRTPNESKDALFHDLPAEQRLPVELEAQRLVREYHLDWLYTHSRAENYRENLYYLSMLESAFSQSAIPLKDELVCADIGVSSWFYVQALYGFLSWYRTPHHRSVHLYGYECDAYRVYSDLRSRYDHALTHIGGLKNVHYVPQAFISQPERFDIILMLFPFVFLKDHLEWGLPGTVFSPQRLLEDVKISLKGDGVLIIVNQGIAEHERQSELLAQIEMPIKLAFRFDSPFYEYKVDRYVIIAGRAV